MSVRGTVAASLGGKQYTLALTMGALAEIEDGLGADNIGAAIALMAQQSIKAMRVVLMAAAKAGGEPLTEDAFAKLEMQECSKALAALISAAFPEVADGGGSATEKN